MAYTSHVRCPGRMLAARDFCGSWGITQSRRFKSVGAVGLCAQYYLKLSEIASAGALRWGPPIVLQTSEAQACTAGKQKKTKPQ